MAAWNVFCKLYNRTFRSTDRSRGQLNACQRRSVAVDDSSKEFEGDIAVGCQPHRWIGGDSARRPSWPVGSVGRSVARPLGCSVRPSDCRSVFLTRSLAVKLVGSLARLHLLLLPLATSELHIQLRGIGRKLYSSSVPAATAKQSSEWRASRLVSRAGRQAG